MTFLKVCVVKYIHVVRTADLFLKIFLILGFLRYIMVI